MQSTRRFSILAIVAALAFAAPAAVFADAATAPVARQEEKASPDAQAPAQEEARYAEREAGNQAAADFRGGSDTVIIGSTTLVIVLLVVLLIVLL